MLRFYLSGCRVFGSVETRCDGSVGVGEMVLGVMTVSVMAFFAGGLNVAYEIDRLPLLYAALIHSVILYLDYAVIYLINVWLADGWIPFLSFSEIFATGFGLI